MQHPKKIHKNDSKIWPIYRLRDISLFFIGGDWGLDSSREIRGYKKAKVIRGTDYKNWQTDKAKNASIRLISSESLEKRKLELGDLIIEVSGGGPDQPVGRCIIIDEKTFIDEIPLICSNFFRRIHLSKSVDPSFINHYLQYLYGLHAFDDIQTNSTNLRNLKFEEYLNIEIPLPSLNEQKAIVSELDVLLDRLKDSKLLLDQIPNMIAAAKQKILIDAITGRLTENWRKKNKKANKLISSSVKSVDKIFDAPQEWNWYTFDELCSEITVGYVGAMSKEYKPDGVPFLRSLNIREFKFDPKDLKYISQKFHQKLSKSSLAPGDIAVVRSGNVGVCAVIPPSLHDANCSDLVIARPNKELYSYYAEIYINSAIIRNYINNNKVGIAQSHFNVGSMKQLPIAIPDINEQKEIARQVSVLYEKLESIEKRYGNLLSKIEALPNKIRGVAFSGELIKYNDTFNPIDLQLIANEKENYIKNMKIRAKVQATAKGTVDISLSDILKTNKLVKNFTFEDLNLNISQGEYNNLRNQMYDMIKSGKISMTFSKSKGILFNVENSKK